MRRWLTLILVSVTFLGLLTIGVWQARKHLPKPEEWARLLEMELTKTLAAPVRIESANVGLTGATIKNLQIQPDPRSPSGYILTVPKIQLRWSLKQILRPSEWKQLVRAQVEQTLHQIVVANATLFLWRDRTGRWNIQPLLAQRPKRPAQGVPALKIRESTLILGDETLPLPNGLPFQMKLVNVQVTVQPIELGARIEASGQILPPLGTPSSQANLTIVQVSNETGQETHGRLIATNIRITDLPKQLQTFGDGKVNLADGTIAGITLNWSQTNEETELSGMAILKGVVFKLSIAKPTTLSPMHSSLSFSLLLTRKQVRNWHLTIRPTQPHPQFGQGVVAIEGGRNFWKVRWRGENLPINTLHSLSTQPIPLFNGNLNGYVSVERERKRIRVDADLTILRTQFRPFGDLQKLRVPIMPISFADAKVSVELRGNRWHGGAEISAKSQIGQTNAKVWLDGRQGKAKVQVENLKLEPLRALVLNLMPSQFRPYVGFQRGLVSGNFTVSWQGRKFRLDELIGRIHQISITGDRTPPLQLSAQARFDGKTLNLSQVRVRLDSNAIANLSGQTTVSRPPVWQVQGQISSSATERLMAWAKAKWNLPIHLLLGGQTQVGAKGIGTQWQAQLYWNEPLLAFDMKGFKWQTRIDKLGLAATPKGSFAVINEITARSTTPHTEPRNLTQHLLDSVKFSEWTFVWDEKRRNLTAFGSVKVPRVDLDGIEIRDGSADLEFAFAPTEKTSAEFRAFNLKAKVLDGELSAGQLKLFAKNESEFTLSALLRFQNSDIGELVRWLKKRRDLDFSAKGRFNGEIALSAATHPHWKISGAKRDGLKARNEGAPQSSETPLTLQAAITGSISEPQMSNSSGEVIGEKLTLTALTVSAERINAQWSLHQIAGEGIGRNFSLRSDERELKIERLQLQSVAKQTNEGWFCDFRLPQIKTLEGTANGQFNISPHRTESRFSFTDLDISQLSRLVDLKFGESLPEGKCSGWFRFEAIVESEGWRGNWEGATLIKEANWQGWSAKLAGARAKGQFSADEKRNLKQISGRIEGVHLLSEDGQAVLDGEFAFRQGVGSLSLQGKWAGVSLRRLSRKFDLPVQLQGLAEGTLKVLWDGKWQVSGTVKSQAVAVGDSAILRDVSGEWFWRDDAVQFRQARAKWNEGILVAEGTVRTSPDTPFNLTIQGEKLALSDLAHLLREWELPLSDWRWFGQTNTQIWASKANGQLRVTVSLNGQQVSLGLAELGKARVDLTFVREMKKDKASLMAKGIVNLKGNGMIVTAELEGTQPNWQVSWHGGNIPINTLRAITKEWQQRNGEKAIAFEQWLKLPVTGEVWTKGKAELSGKQITGLQATVSIPNLQGIGNTSTQANLTIARAEKVWSVQLREIKQGNANAFGSISVTDDGELSGELTMNRVSPELAMSLLTLLGVKVESESMPEGSLSARLKFAGNRESPIIEGTLQASDVYWRGWAMRQILVRRFELRDGIVKVSKGDGIIRWRTDASLASFWGWSELRNKRKMQWQIELPPTYLDAILPPDLPLKITRGWLSGSLSLQGSWDEPSLEGSIEVVADVVDFAASNSLPKPIEPLTKLQNFRCQIAAEGRRAKLVKLEANFSGGIVTGNGWLELGERGLQNLFANRGELRIKMQGVRANWNGTEVNLKTIALKGDLNEKGFGLSVEQLRGEGLEAQGNVQWQQIPQNGWAWLSEGKWDLKLQVERFRWQSKGAKGRLSGYLALRSERENSPPTLRGNLTIHDGDILRLPVVAAGGEGKWRFPQALQLALKLEIGDRFFLRNPQASLLLDGELLLAGDLSQPRVEGELRSQRGTLRLPAAVLTITDMSLRVAYAVDSLTRRWLGTARMRVEGETQLDIHRILFTVSGPVDEQSQRLGILPSVTMLAIPPLPEQTALERMFGLGLAQLGDVLTNWQQLFSGTFVQSFMGNLLAPVTEPIAQTLRWTELSVIREQTTGKQWLRLGIPIASRLHVLWRQGLSPADPSALEVQYYLGKRTSVTIIKREREQAEVRVQTSVRF
ncbi:MAG: translocation/assembly module TamB domain-containing protein [Armatimonadota bacterium]